MYGMTLQATEPPGQGTFSHLESPFFLLKHTFLPYCVELRDQPAFLKCVSLNLYREDLQSHLHVGEGLNQTRSLIVEAPRLCGDGHFPRKAMQDRACWPDGQDTEILGDHITWSRVPVTP